MKHPFQHSAYIRYSIHMSCLSILYPQPKASLEKPTESSQSATTTLDVLVIASSCPSCSISLSLLPQPLLIELRDTSQYKAINRYTGLNRSDILFCPDPSQLSLLVRPSLAMLSKIATTPLPPTPYFPSLFY